jgi:hypothetical protein
LLYISIDLYSSIVEDQQCEQILSNGQFDILYSYILHFQTLSPIITKILIRTINEGITLLLTKIKSLFQSQNDDTENKNNYRNLLKSYLFCLNSIIKLCEKSCKEMKEKDTTIKEKGKKKPVKKLDFDWMIEKQKCIGTLINILESEFIYKLWNMSSPEETVGIVCFESGIAVLENQEHMKEKVTNKKINQKYIVITKIKLYVNFFLVILFCF